MHRFFADPDRIEGRTAYLADEDAKHAITVLRLKSGQTIELFADSIRYSAKILSTDHHEVLVEMISPLPSTEPALSVTLFQGIPKSEKMDLIVQKSTELGIQRIVPVNMNRCVAKITPEDSARKLNRWRKIAREAAKQSGRCMIPEIMVPCTLNRLAYELTLPETNLVPWEEANGMGPRKFHDAHLSLSSLGILVGPEGGIDHDEIDFLRTLGFIPVTLGKRILRTETAGIAALSAFMCLYGEME